MHPELFTIPGLNWTVPSYGFAMAVAFLVGVVLSVYRAKRVGARSETVTSMAAIGGVAGVVGARGMHLVHYYWDALRGGAMDTDDVVAAIAGGGEVLGGVVLASLCVAVYLAVTRQSIRLYLDVIMPPMILAMGIGRIGCLLYGCCWGQVCATDAGERGLAWAVRFPYGSPAYLMQWYRGQLDVPEELMWTPPGSERDRPLQRNILWDPALESDPVLAEAADRMAAVADLRAEDSKDPRIAEHRAAVQDLRNRLPGRTKQEKLDYVAALVHIRRQAEADGVSVEAEVAELRELASASRSRWVHPTQLYDAIALLLLFLLLSAIFYRRKRHGVVAAWTLVLYGASRFVQESIRGDNPRDVGGLTVSQFISLVMILVGLAAILAIVRLLPARSPRAPGELAATG